MSFPKLLKFNQYNCDSIKVAAAVGAFVVAGETYQGTGSWKLALASLMTALLSGNIVTARRD